MKSILLSILFTASLHFQACKSNPAPVATTVPAADTIPADTGYIPAPTGYVSDFVHLFTPAQAQTLDSLIRNYEKKTTVEIAIVTLDSNMVGQQDFDAYTVKLANSWRVGKKQTNNGIVIAIAPYMRRIRISNGLGIEKMLSDAETKEIIDNTIVPNFKKGEFYEGTRQGLLAIMKKLE